MAKQKKVTKITIAPQELWLEMFRIIISIAEYEEVGSENLKEAYACHLRPIQKNIIDLSKEDDTYAKLLSGVMVLAGIYRQKLPVEKQEVILKALSESFDIDFNLIKNICLNKEEPSTYKHKSYKHSIRRGSSTFGEQVRLRFNLY